MVEKTCAACDCKLEGDSIKVEIGGKAVEVCCEACARKLREAHASAAAPGKRSFDRRHSTVMAQQTTEVSHGARASYPPA